VQRRGVEGGQRRHQSAGRPDVLLGDPLLGEAEDSGVRRLDDQALYGGADSDRIVRKPRQKFRLGGVEAGEGAPVKNPP
jgi:hypothetical protein